MKISFYGACRQITGSCYLLETGEINILVDCGLYQEREFYGRNWNPFPFNARNINYLVLTHIHLDHCGLIPKLVKEGFKGKILMTDPSNDLLPIMLFDSAKIQEEDAAYKKKRHKREKRKSPYPVIPLYTTEDVEECLPLFHSVPIGENFTLSENAALCFHDAGHILGSSMLEFKIKKDGKERTIVFSGDIGQWDKPLMKDPSLLDRADYVVMETLYANRVHEDPQSIDEKLKNIINDTVKAHGNVVIPTFAVERAQELLYHLSLLVRADDIPYMMMFLDSPMAVDVTDLFSHHTQFLDHETKEMFRKGKSPFKFPGLKLIRSVAESKAINTIRGSCLVMAGSGMCTGGRVKHHLVKNISNPGSTIIFVGYQAYGTLGRLIQEGKDPVRIHGQYYKVRARIEDINGFSAHADRNQLYRWISHFKPGPKKIFLTHGDYDSAEDFAQLIRKEKGWETVIPNYMNSINLDFPA